MNLPLMLLPVIALQFAYISLKCFMEFDADFHTNLQSKTNLSKTRNQTRLKRKHQSFQSIKLNKSFALFIIVIVTN